MSFRLYRSIGEPWSVLQLAQVQTAQGSGGSAPRKTPSATVRVDQSEGSVIVLGSRTRLVRRGVQQFSLLHDGLTVDATHSSAGRVLRMEMLILPLIQCRAST